MALQQQHQLLLVEDDAAVADVVALHLRSAGYSVQHAADGHAAMRFIDTQSWDLVLLDLMLPGANGFEICRRLRERAGHVPVIILSARVAEADRVLGLELGADDYMAKPFSMLELAARVRALLRRVEQLRTAPVVSGLQLGSLHIHLASRKVSLAGAELALTLREFDLLYFLARHPGQIFSRSELLQRVWGEGFDGYEHTVNSHINRLRSKMEQDTSAPRWIETVWGLGYRLHAPAEPKPALRSVASETAGTAALYRAIA
jgi:DNA-binding response OmpR family regulator